MAEDRRIRGWKDVRFFGAVALCSRTTMNEDAQLLHRYAAQADEAAFTEFVGRHVRIVYAIAARQLGSEQHADDVAQQVFLAVARDARRLAGHPQLLAWLYATARNAARDAARRDLRRRRRELRTELDVQATSPMDTLESESARRLVDAAVDSLDPTARSAVLLRFFEGRSFSEIGAQLGMSENTARMRVERALSKLHQFLARRGIATSVAAVGSSLGSYAASAVLPAGAPAAVAAAALAAAKQTAAIGAVSAFVGFMGKSKTIAAALAVAGVAGAGFGVARLTQPSSNIGQPPMVARSVAADPEFTRVAEQLAAVRADNQSLRDENARLHARLHQALEADSGTVPSKVGKLRDSLKRLPEQAIPEFALLEEDDWYAAVDGPLESTDDFRRAFSILRSRAEKRFLMLAHPALKAYLDANGGQFPKSSTELAEYFTKPVDEALLLRYRVAPASTVPNVRMGGDWILTQVARVDSEMDDIVVIGPAGHGRTSPGTQDGTLIQPVVQAFSRANPGVRPTDPSQFLPYATTVEQRAAIERMMRQVGRGRR